MSVSAVSRRIVGAAARRMSATWGAIVGRFVDAEYLDHEIPPPNLTVHEHLVGRFAEMANRPGWRVLEIGSREVTGPSDLRWRLDVAEYVGFDYYPGPNVDVVGDAHKLSSYFDGQFDAIFTSAVFEHLAMPWVVADEIRKLLKVGGLLVVETHFSYSSHERPWHFFQFSDMALRALFSEAAGFECLEATMQNPIVGRFSHHASPYLRYRPVPRLYCHSDFIGRKVAERPDFDWRSVDLDALLGTASKYPSPAKG